MQMHDQLARMDAQQLREFAAKLIATVVSKDRELRYKELKIAQLTHEMAVLKRWKFAARSEQLHGASAACSMRPSMPISKPSAPSSRRCDRRSAPQPLRTSRSVPRCRRT